MGVFPLFLLPVVSFRSSFLLFFIAKRTHLIYGRRRFAHTILVFVCSQKLKKRKNTMQFRCVGREERGREGGGRGRSGVKYFTYSVMRDFMWQKYISSKWMAAATSPDHFNGKTCRIFFHNIILYHFYILIFTCLSLDSQLTASHTRHLEALVGDSYLYPIHRRARRHT